MKTNYRLTFAASDRVTQSFVLAERHKSQGQFQYHAILDALLSLSYKEMAVHRFLDEVNDYALKIENAIKAQAAIGWGDDFLDIDTDFLMAASSFSTLCSICRAALDVTSKFIKTILHSDLPAGRRSQLPQSYSDLLEKIRKAPTDFPEPLFAFILATAQWFDPLKTIRDRINHYSEGNLGYDESTHTLLYVFMQQNARTKEIRMRETAKLFVDGLTSVLDRIYLDFEQKSTKS